MPDMTEIDPLLDPDCRDGKCGSCVGGPCEHHCHRTEAEKAEVAELRAKLADAERRILPAPERTPPDGTAKPFPCTRCGQQVRIGEELHIWADFGPAVLDPDGMVRTPESETAGSFDQPHEHRTYAICPNPECGYRWRLRRSFDGGAS